MQRILVALDSSKRATGVLAAASQLATQTGAKLILYRAVGIPPELPRELFEATDGDLEDLLVRRARTDLDQLASELPAGQIERVITGFATAWDGICRAASEQEADLIVIGSHGYHGLDRVLGTTASKVVNHADRNVLVVRARP